MSESKGCLKFLISGLVKMMLIWCAAVSIRKTKEANEAAQRRRDGESYPAQEWEFDRVYSGALGER